MPQLGLSHTSFLSAGWGKVETQAPDGSIRTEYPKTFDPGDETIDHLVFALKHDGLDLRVLRAVLDDHADLYRHLDLTAHVEALYRWLERTVEHEMLDEVAFLERFDRAVEGVREVREMPDKRERLFIQCVVQNKGKLSKGKRGQFAEIPDDELARMEAAVRDAFELDPVG